MTVNLVATWIPTFIIALLGVLRLVGNQQVVQELTALGVGRHLRLLGVMELAFATLFVFPTTFKIGFLLASRSWRPFSCDSRTPDDSHA